jgi:hypothetical protein
MDRGYPLSLLSVGSSGAAGDEVLYSGVDSQFFDKLSEFADRCNTSIPTVIRLEIAGFDVSNLNLKNARHFITLHFNDVEINAVRKYADQCKCRRSHLIDLACRELLKPDRPPLQVSPAEYEYCEHKIRSSKNTAVYQQLVTQAHRYGTSVNDLIRSQLLEMIGDDIDSDDNAAFFCESRYCKDKKTKSPLLYREARNDFYCCSCRNIVPATAGQVP